MIVPAHTVPDPGAMMVHPYDTLVADSTVMNP